MSDTREKILDVAERLFAEGGIGGTSLRSIIAEAQVNQAAVHYHFGSKEVLVRAVFERRLTPLNQERLGLLAKAEAEAGDDSPDLYRVLGAFVGPALRLSQDPSKGGAVFMKLMGRSYFHSESTQALLQQSFDEVIERFSATLQHCLPQVCPEALAWRFHFIIGAMAYTMCDRYLIERVGRGKVDSQSVEDAVEHLVDFLANGLSSGTEVTKGKSGGRTAVKAKGK